MKKNVKTDIVIPIIQDTREQKPLEFVGYSVSTVVHKLDYGDYSIQGLEKPEHPFSICVERKADCQELCGNIGSNWERFKRELEVMAQYKHKIIVVCGPNNFNWLCHSKLTALNFNYVCKQITEIYCKYGINVFFANSREEAENYIYRLFKNVYKDYLGSLNGNS